MRALRLHAHSLHAHSWHAHPWHVRVSVLHAWLHAWLHAGLHAWLHAAVGARLHAWLTEPCVHVVHVHVHTDVQIRRCTGTIQRWSSQLSGSVCECLHRFDWNTRRYLSFHPLLF